MFDMEQSHPVFSLRAVLGRP